MNWYAKSNQYYIRGENAESLTRATGEAGEGYYFSPASNEDMVRHYTETSSHIWKATPKGSCRIEDLTSPKHIAGIIEVIGRNIERLKKQMVGYIEPKVNFNNYQRFSSSIEDYVKSLGNVDAYLISHRGPNIPSGKQLIILNLDAFELEMLK